MIYWEILRLLFLGLLGNNMNLVNDIFGTDLNAGVQLAIIFGVLLVVLLLVVWLVRLVFGNNVSRMAKNRQPRLAVTDAAIVDDKRRLVLVRRDDVEHLILIGGNSDVLVESNISRVRPVQIPNTGQTQTISNTKENSTRRTSIERTPNIERTAKSPSTSFVSNIKNNDSVGNAGNSMVQRVAAVGTVGTSSAIAAVPKPTTAKVSTGGTDNVDAINDTAIKSTSDVISGPVVNNTNLTKSSVISVESTEVAASSETAKAKVEVAKSTEEKDIKNTGVTVSDSGADVTKESSIGDGIETKSSAEIDLEQILNGDDDHTSNTGDDDMQKILNELTEEIK